MDHITVIRRNDGSVRVMSQDDHNCTDNTSKRRGCDNEQMMIAFAMFLGYDPSEVLCFN